MTIEELKSKATASELVLIEKLEELIATNARNAAIEKMLRWMDKNPPPTERDMMMGNTIEIMRGWLRRLETHLKEE